MKTDRIPLVRALTFTSLVAVLGTGCLLKVEGLDAGLDEEANDADTYPETNGDGDGDHDPLECLLGTEDDTVGTARALFDTACDVTCETGWGHDGDQLGVAWTTHVTNPDPDADGEGIYGARALGLLENGRLVVAVETEDELDLAVFEADGLSIGGFPVPNIRAHVYGVAIVENRVYTAHGDDDGTVVLSALDIDSQQELWAREYAGGNATQPARGSAHVGFLLAPQLASSARDLVVVDLDGEPVWTTPTVDSAGGLAFSPSGDRVAVTGETVRIYAIEDGALVDEIVHAEQPVAAGRSTFLGEDALVTVGAVYSETPLQGWLALDSLDGAGGDWEQLYNRASDWCPTPGEDGGTGEWLLDVAALPDGSVFVTGHEGHKQDQQVGLGSNPWVAHVSADGEFLAGDRGLWRGYGTFAVASPDGSAHVLSVDLPEPGEPNGFRLRKYLP